MKSKTNASLKEPIQETPVMEKPEVEKDDGYDFSVDITRDYYGNIDPFYLSKKDPNYDYRFIRDEAKNISLKTSNMLLQKGAWQLTPKAHLLKIGIKERELSPDGFLRRGDTILAFIPKKFSEEKQKYKIQKANEPMEMVNRKLKEGDPQFGKEIHDSMKGIQTEKQLGMK